MKNERKLVDREGPVINYTSLDRVLYERDKILKEEPSATKFEIETRQQYYDDYTVILVYKSLESDEEFEDRIGREELQRTEKEERERAEYERLKRKFGV